MELHFPHLTNGIVAPKRIKKRSITLPLIVASLAIVAIAYIRVSVVRVRLRITPDKKIYALDKTNAILVFGIHLEMLKLKTIF